MLTKQSVKKTVDKLPSSFTLDDLVDELIFLDKVEEGLKQSKAGKTHSSSEAKKRLKKWLK